MQIFKLVSGGHVDRLIGFDELPESLLSGIRRGSLAGLPSYWGRYIGGDINDPNYRPFYILDYVWLNKDKDKWSEISSYVRRNVSSDSRLLDRLEDMAIRMAPDTKSQVSIDPENVPVISVSKPVGKPGSPSRISEKRQDKRFGRKLSDEHKKKMNEARLKKKKERDKESVAA